MKSTVTQGKSFALSSQAVPPSSLQNEAFQHWYAEGETLANAGAYERARRCFEEAAIVAPGNVSALVYQAVCFIHLGQLDQALALADRVLAIAPDHAQGWLYRGVALHRLGRYQEAYACYARVQPA